MKALLKTPVSYYGGKQALLSHILPIIPEHEVYTEVFFGGGAVFFAKRPAKNETINDIDGRVVNFYEQLKSNSDELLRLINQTLISRLQHRRALDMIKGRTEARSVELAWAFWCCTTLSFSNKIGGGYKYSNDMGTVVPDTLANHKASFATGLLQKRIEHAYIECADALKILRSRNVSKGFHYVDPPYMNADQGHYSGYTQDQFMDLLSFLQNECKGKFLLSNYQSDMLADFIKRNNWNYKLITRRLQASGKKDGRNKIEIMVWNYDVHPKLFDYAT